MSAELVSALLGGVAVTYTIGDLWRKHFRERLRERRIAARQEELDAKFARLTEPSYAGAVSVSISHGHVEPAHLFIAHGTHTHIREQYQRALYRLLLARWGYRSSDPVDEETHQLFLQEMREREREREAAPR
jgi:hypothetical protein